MPSKRNDSPGRDTASAIKAAAAIATADEPDINAAANKMVCIRLNEHEHRKIKALFSKAGVPLATGVKLAALYVSELVEDGALKLTSAGIIDRRGG
jgi:hypothetical protein